MECQTGCKILFDLGFKITSYLWKIRSRIVILFICALAATNYFITKHPANQSLGHQLSDMEQAIEQQFDCQIDKTKYSLIVWHQQLYFGYDSTSKNRPLESEVAQFLAANFHEFRFIDEFEID